MAQNITLMGASYSDVPAVTLPKTGGGTATFIDVADTTAASSDVASGKYFYTAAGVRTQGTGGSGGSVSITDESNATGTTCVITTGSSPTPPSETWETVYNNTPTVNNDTPYNYFWLSSLSDVYPTVGSVWRITANNNEYRCTAYSMSVSGAGAVVCVGNPKYSGGTDDGSGVTFNFYNAGWGAWTGDTELSGTVSLKIEQLVTD